MKIIREEVSTGGKSRTPREEIKPLITGDRGAEPEQYVDASPSEDWPWNVDPTVRTWDVQLASVKGFVEPFAVLDTEAANETLAGGVATYPFSSEYLPLSDQKDEDGKTIIDVNPSNFDERFAAFTRLHSGFFENGRPRWGGTKITTALKAGDEHFMEEFGERPVSQRPVRLRVVWTDGILNDGAEFIAYLSDATAVNDPTVSSDHPIGRHGEWDEIWAVAIFGEEGGEGHTAYEQYVKLAKDHPWIHVYYFPGVTNGLEVAEDMAIAGVPTQA